jgi:hypothetical protein
MMVRPHLQLAQVLGALNKNARDILEAEERVKVRRVGMWATTATLMDALRYPCTRRCPQHSHHAQALIARQTELAQERTTAQQDTLLACLEDPSLGFTSTPADADALGDGRPNAALLAHRCLIAWAGADLATGMQPATQRLMEGLVRVMQRQLSEEMAWKRAHTLPSAPSFPRSNSGAADYDALLLSTPDTNSQALLVHAAYWLSTTTTLLALVQHAIPEHASYAQEANRQRAKRAVVEEEGSAGQQRTSASGWGLARLWRRTSQQQSGGGSVAAAMATLQQQQLQKRRSIADPAVADADCPPDVSDALSMASHSASRTTTHAQVREGPTLACPASYRYLACSCQLLARTCQRLCQFHDSSSASALHANTEGVSDLTNSWTTPAGA